MGIIKKLSNLLYAKNEITHSPVTNVFTKYGKYQIKAYKDENEEYLAIMSQNFFDLKQTLVYVHSDQHACDPHEADMCYCNNQMDMALKMIGKSGGLIIYYSHDARNIDGLLQEMNTRKLETVGNSAVKSNVKFDINNQIAYPSLGFIFKDLKLEQIRLITNDLKMVKTIDLLGIKILKREASIAFKYGLR